MATKRQRQGQSGNPARRANPGGTGPSAPPPSGSRAALNRASAPVLMQLHRMPRWLLPVVMGLSLAGGLFFSGDLAWLGTLLLALVAAVVGWLYVLSWPALPPGGRLARGLVLAALIGLTALKATGGL